MPTMRILIFLSLALLASPILADSLRSAQQVYQAGAPHLALAMASREQGENPTGDWYEWESLRLSALSDTHQATEILKRASLYTPDAPPDFQQKALGHLAWAELELHHARRAREILARLLWQFDLPAADQQWARRLVIRAYLSDHLADDAYRAMLRYDQDYAPVGKIVATEFVEGLLQEQRATEALSWLPQLDPGSASAARLKLKAGLGPAQTLFAQAQAALRQPKPNADYALLSAEAAALLHEPALTVAGWEQWLDLSNTQGGHELELWQSYLDYAAWLGNRAQLLQGDDGAWRAQAQVIQSSDALGARALYAYLVTQARTKDERIAALSALFEQLALNGHEVGAARLFNAAPWGEPKLSAVFLASMVAQINARTPEPLRRHIFLAAALILAQAQDALGAAAYFVQAELIANTNNSTAGLDAASQLARAGYPEEAARWQRYRAAQAATRLKRK